MNRALVFSAGLAAGDDSEGLASLRGHASRLARLYPLWYAGGEHRGAEFRSLADAARKRAVAEICAASGVELWPRLVASAVEPGLASTPLGEALRADGVQGLCLDPGPLPGDSEGAAALLGALRDLRHALRSAGLKLGLVARFGDAPSATAPPAWAEACDLLRVPLFRDWAVDPLPGPLAPKPWLDAVLDRLASGADLDTVEAVLPSGGCDWLAPGAAPQGLPYAAWPGLVAAHPPERRDPESREVFLRADGREAWMNDAISLSAKLWEARRRGLSQASLWRLGPEDPRWWAFLDALPEVF